MQAVVLNEPGDAGVLKVTEVPTPKVKPGWSLIKIKGFGINRSEIFTRNGWSPTVNLPRILGIEGVGEIADTTDPKRLPKGQTVVTLMHGMGREFDGSYAEYALIPNDSIYPIKTTLSWTNLAAIPETYFTAYGSLLNLKITGSDSLLIRGATSGVGVAAAKLARVMAPRIKIYGTTRNLAKSDELANVGFDGVIEDRHNDLQTDCQFDKVLELVGELTLVDSLQYLHEGSILCLTGSVGGSWSVKNFGLIGTLPSGAYLTDFSSDSVTEDRFNDLLSIIDKNKLDVAPVRTFDLAHTGDAQAYLDSQHSFGKVVVLP